MIYCDCYFTFVFERNHSCCDCVGRANRGCSLESCKLEEDMIVMWSLNFFINCVLLGLSVCASISSGLPTAFFVFLYLARTGISRFFSILPSIYDKTLSCSTRPRSSVVSSGAKHILLCRQPASTRIFAGGKVDAIRLWDLYRITSW